MHKLTTSNSILIVGASARAAAESAVRAGLGVLALDLFADCDLRAIAQTNRIVPSYPDDAVAIAMHLPATTWLFTGGIENHPNIIKNISERHQLMGVEPHQIARLRTQELLQRSVKQTSFRFPQTVARPSSDVKKGGWLVKPNGSCGGTDVHFSSPRPRLGDEYLQEFIRGNSYSAAFVADGQHCQFLGVTQQWLAKDSPAHKVKSQRSPFAYIGSTGPLPQVSQSYPWESLGKQLTVDFNLVGVFGVDVVITDEGDPYVVELNPRYTASMEVIEPTLRQPIIQLHLAACTGKLSNDALRTGTSSVFGKAYFFATEPCEFGSGPAGAVVNFPSIDDWRNRIADIPAIGTKFETNEPVVTLFEASDCHDEVISELGLSGNTGWLQRFEQTLSCRRAS